MTTEGDPRGAVDAAVRRLDAALGDWKTRTDRTAKALADAQGERDKEIKRGEKEIKRRSAATPVRIFGSTILLDDEIKIRGNAHRLGPDVTAVVELGKKDVFLRLQGDGWGEVLKVDHKKEAKARDFAQMVEVAAQRAPEVRAKREAEVGALRNQLEGQRADTSTVDELREAHEAARAEQSEVLAAIAALEETLASAGASDERWFRAAVKRLAGARLAIGVPTPPDSPLATQIASAERNLGGWRRWTRGWRLGVAGAGALFILLIAVASLSGGGEGQSEAPAAATTEAARGTEATRTQERQPETATTDAQATSTPEPSVDPAPSSAPDLSGEIALMSMMSEGMGRIAETASEAGECVDEACVIGLASRLAVLARESRLDVQASLPSARVQCVRAVGRNYINMTAGLERVDERPGDLTFAVPILLEATQRTQALSGQISACQEVVIREFSGG